MHEPHDRAVHLTAQVAEDMMTAHPTTLHEGANLQEAALLLSSRGFSAAPVVDDDRRVVGVISLSDLVAAQAHPAISPALDASTRRSPDDLESTETVVYRPSSRVAEVMNPHVYSVRPSTPAIDVVRHMLNHGVHRLFVVDERSALVGVISATDVLRHLKL